MISYKNYTKESKICQCYMKNMKETLTNYTQLKDPETSINKNNKITN